MKCIRCGQEIYLPHWNSNICGTCADDLRAEQDAERMALANEANREAYEDAMAEERFDNGNGYRYI